jgi:hypothetical protein
MNINNKVLSQVSKWFSANKLSLILDKANVIKLITNDPPQTLDVMINIEKRQ